MNLLYHKAFMLTINSEEVRILTIVHLNRGQYETDFFLN